MRQLLFIFFVFISGFSFSQVNGNEWIDYNQTYYKIDVFETGIHKLTFETLQSAGIDIATIPTDNFQIFGREKQVPLFIQDGGDNTLNAGDYILFYAEKNDGWLDSILYINPEGIGNPGYSLYNDTIHYFFTWNTNGNNSRFLPYNNTNFSAFPNSVPYLIKQTVLSYNNNYFDLKAPDGYNSSSFFVDGEGWGGAQFNGINGTTKVYDFATPTPYTASDAPATKFVGLSVSNSNATNTVVPGGPNHNFSWLFGTSQEEIYQASYNGYQQHRVYKDISSDKLSNGTTSVRFKVNASSNYATDYQAVSYLSLTYPQQPDMGGNQYGEFWVKNSTNAAINRVKLQNAPLAQGYVFTFDHQPKVIVPSSISANEFQFLLPNNSTNSQQKIVVSTPEKFILITNIQPVSASGKFTHYQVDPNDSKTVLMIYHPSMAASSADYANYRRSPAGGSYSVILANIEELYDQYGGGINKHILAIRRFAQDIASTSNYIPEALYLLGKGVREANDLNNNSTGARKSSTYRALDLIPSFGYPSSDNAITAGLGNTHWEPLIPTGRIAAKNDEELNQYLEKVKQYDEYNSPMSVVYTSENRDWQKHIIHFSGGTSLSDQNEFSYYLNGMKNIIEDSLFGGHVTTIKKESSLPLDPVIVSEVTERISEGATLLNFFGHASADGFEINIDEPNNWNNQGKYPVVIGNACYSGDIYHANPSISERFVLTPQQGAIAFMSTVKTGFGFSLNNYTSEFYRQLGYKSYKKPIGYLIKETIKAVYNINNQSIYNETTCSQMSLHGDPLLIINSHDKSEIEIKESSLSFNPNTFNLSQDSVEVKLALTNIGKSVTDTFTIDFTRTYPNGVDSLYHFTLPKLHYKDTIAFKIPLGGSNAAGINQISVDVDLPSQIDEFEDITNNQIKKNLFVDIEGILPVYPYNYAVVPYDTVTVKASTINPIANWKTYRFELDTTDTYDSPEKRVAIVSGYGGVKEVRFDEWKSTSNSSKPLTCTDSTVYYWRVAIDSTVLDWNEFSFQYIPKKEGWGQAHFFQFKNNDFYGIDYVRNDRSRVFEDVPITLGAKVVNKPSSNEEFNANAPTMNGQNIDYGMCFTNNSFHVAVIDPVTMQPWGKYWNGQNPTHQFGNVNNNSGCRNRMEYLFIFRQNTAEQLQNFQSMLDQIPDGYYIIVHTANRTDTTNWSDVSPSIFETFTNIGASQIQNSHNRSFVLVYQKGNPNFVREMVSSEAAGEVLIASFPVITSKTNGVETSPFIGPSQKWETVYWKHLPTETISSDSCRLNIKYYDITQNPVGDLNYLMTPQDSILQLNSIIDAQQYPYIKLTANYFDTLNKTPAQLNRWHVLYQPVPEAAIDGSSLYTWLPNKDSLMQGEKFKFAVDVKNISDYPMDSLLVHYWIENANHSNNYLNYPRQDSLRVLQTLRDTIEVSTDDLYGDNILWMEINPYINGELDQIEQYHFNNILQIPFTVSGDKINPILDVTFDGIHILNKDIINPRSEILITLKDENPYFIMNELADTSKFGIYLINPYGVQTRIPFIENGNEILQVTLADAQTKRFKILYHADFQEDGVYTLLVQGSDKSNNLSGKLEYKIQFEVINETTITYLMNYPNPFSTSTRFVFTLTGSRVPDNMIIQIMTVTGKVVREITMNELGPLKIGRNITEYAWDGRDEFGDQLANGVYLYRVLNRLDGETIKHRDSGADKYFKKEFGKMYLMR